RTFCASYSWWAVNPQLPVRVLCDETCRIKFSRLTAALFLPADSHADFSNLQCDSDLAGGARAAPRDEFQSLVDMRALGSPPFPAARSGALGPDKSQPGAYASAFAAIASRGNLPR